MLKCYSKPTTLYQLTEGKTLFFLMFILMAGISCKQRTSDVVPSMRFQESGTICIDSFARVFYPNSIMLNQSVNSILDAKCLDIDTTCTDSFSIDKACIIIGLKLFYYQLTHTHQSYNLLDMIDDNSSFIVYRLIMIRDKVAYPNPLSGDNERYFPSFVPMDYVANNLILLNDDEIALYYKKINATTDSLKTSNVD